VTCVYSHFSISANRRVQLQDFFDFVDLEYSDLLRHVPTRWLSLGPAIERLLKSWPAVISYFQSLGEECPKRIQKNLGLKPDRDDGGMHIKVKEAYLHFIRNLCCVFEQSVLILERDNFSFCELFPVMQDLRNKLKDRLNDKFFGVGAQSVLRSDIFTEQMKQSIEADFCIGLQKAISYLEQCFNFSSEAIPSVLQTVALKSVPNFRSLSDACSALGLDADIDIDAMYNEFSSAKVALEHIVQSQASAGEKWQTFFKACGPQIPKNMFKLVAYILSMPGSNAFPERVFSLMNTKWRAERNRASAALIKSELQVFVNFVYSCSAFYDFVLKEQKLLDAAASNTKYTWKSKASTSTC